jgi:hypothetical protein
MNARTHATSIAAAAVLLVAIVGCQPAAGTGRSGSPTIVPSASDVGSPGAVVSTSPPVAAAYPSWYTPESGSGGAGILAAGSHATMSFVPRFAFTVPEGWVNDADSAGFFSLFPDTPANAAEHAASGGFAHGIHLGLMDSPYFLCEALESNRGATAAEMVADLVANDALATEPVDVAIGGLTGKQVDVRLDPGWTGSCPGDPPGLDLKDVRVRGILLDSPGHGVLVIFASSLHAADHEAFLAEAMPILESFQFDAAP